MNIEEYATITAKVFKPGTHNGGEFPPERVAAMVASANACSDFINETIESGMYPENDFPLDKPIPGWLNLNHQGFLTETIKNAVNGVQAEFRQEGEWIVAVLRGVKDEIAQFLKAGFPYRSIELIPELFNPKDGKTYKDVIRSVGFLMSDPAVPQEPGYAVEFELQKDSPFILLYSHDEETSPITPIEEGDQIMEDTKTTQEETLDVQEPQVSPAVPVEEYQAMKTRQAEQEQKIQEMQAQLMIDAEEKAEIQARLNAEQQIREEQDIKMYCDHLTHEAQASPAFIALISPHLAHANHSEIVEFSAEQKLTQRKALQELFEGVIEMAKKDGLTVTVGDPLNPGAEDPLKAPETKAAKQERLVAEFTDEAKAQAKDPNDTRDVYNIALTLALAKYGDALK